MKENAEILSPETCRSCDDHARTGLDGFVQSGCMLCMAREIAAGQNAHRRESDPTALQAEMRKAWPAEADYRRGRALVWAHIQRLSGSDVSRQDEQAKSTKDV